MARSYRFFLLDGWGHVEPLQCTHSVPFPSIDQFVRQTLSIILDTCSSASCMFKLFSFFFLKCLFQATEKWVCVNISKKKRLRRSHHLLLNSLNFISKYFIDARSLVIAFSAEHHRNDNNDRKKNKKKNDADDDSMSFQFNRCSYFKLAASWTRKSKEI